MGVIGRAALNPSLLKVTRMDVPELGGEMLLREYAAADVQRVAIASQGLQGDAGNLRTMGLLIALAWVDEAGERILTNDADIDTMLAVWPLELVQRIAGVVNNASGLVPDAVDDAKKN